ncbi:MAG: hypothetical protein AB7F96_10440 [Beijerinckiaceae bacterium]
MQIVQGDTLEWRRGLEYRGGMFHFRKLLEGEEGSIGNFQLSMGRSDKDFLSPRHRHNFEQFRIQLDGDLKFGRDGTMKPGMVAYFPEGAHYGPQTQDGDATTFVLQFGGASGSGYLSRNEVSAGMKALENEGSFKDGIFRRNEGAEGKRNMDGYEAIWSHIRGRKLDYPKPRYPGPIMMDRDHFHWARSRSEAGVWEKPMGVFTERRAEVGMLKLEGGASTVLTERSVHVCIEGSGTVEAGGQTQEFRKLTVIHCAPGEQATVRASEECVFYKMILPDLAGLEEDAGSDRALAAE